MTIAQTLPHHVICQGKMELDHVDLPSTPSNKIPTQQANITPTHSILPALPALPVQQATTVHTVAALPIPTAAALPAHPVQQATTSLAATAPAARTNEGVDSISANTVESDDNMEVGLEVPSTPPLVQPYPHQSPQPPTQSQNLH